MQNKKIFLVIGMHRSGTSLVVNCLNSLGLRLSDDLVSGAKDNPNGFFEDAKIVEFNSAIEKHLGREHMTPSSVLPLPSSWQDDDVIIGISAQIRDYLAEVVSSSEQPLVLKDPRMCRLLPLYVEILSSIGVTPYCVFVYHGVRAVMQSKCRRDLLPYSAAELQWQSHNMNALSTIFEGGLAVSFLCYEQLIAQSEVSIDRLGRFLKLNGLDCELLPLPEIRPQSEDQSFNRELALYPLSDFSVELMAFLDTCCDNDALPGCEFRALLTDYQAWQKSSAQLLDVVRFCENSSADASASSMSVLRLKASLKESNERISSLENRLQERENTHRSLLTGGRISSVYQRATAYFAKTLNRINSNGTAVIVIRRVKFFMQRVFSLLLRFRQLVNNKGLKQACIFSVKTLQSFVAKKRRLLSGRNKIQAHRQSAEHLHSWLNQIDLNLSVEQLKLVSNMFVVEYYVLEAGLEQSTPYLDGLKHFLSSGVHQGLSPSPLFNASTYLEQLGLSESSLELPIFLHWLNHGVEQRIVPTILIDEAFVLQKHPIVLSPGRWSFDYFVTKGVFNNIAPNQYFEPDWYRLNHDMAGSTLPAFYHYLVTGYKLGWRPSPLFSSFSRKRCSEMEVSPLEYVMSQINFAEIRKRTMSSDVLVDLVKKAHSIEPKIKLPDPSFVQRLNVHPYSNPCFPGTQELRESLAHTHYENVVLIPHCRYGGSGLVAGELCHSLVRSFSFEKTLLVRTDNDDFMRPDWFPDAIDIVNLLDYGCDLQDEYRKKSLLDLLIGLKPKRVFNVHSRLGWQVFQEFGDRLALWTSLYGYTFCYDVNMVGAKVGYPIKYVPSCIDSMEALFVDNSFVKSDMALMNKWSQEQADKVKVLWTPYQNASESESAAAPVLSIEKKGRKNIFWAGRFDRQKRFDLVVKLAHANPQWDFWVWGAAMLGDDAVTKNLPFNVHLNGLFKSYTEIPFDDCDVWLYTSQWDGVPTILIELGLREVSLVASKVWGTADLISDETAWPVSRVSNVSDYQAQLEAALADPVSSKRKSGKMKTLIESQHNRGQYDQSLLACLQRNKGEAA